MQKQMTSSSGELDLIEKRWNNIPILVHCAKLVMARFCLLNRNVITSKFDVVLIVWYC